MTECERIIKHGILQESFFEPEFICDFYVDEKRKKIWAVELDMLILLDTICKKHGLTYYLTDGSLLGAIRHNGFIPWDDDIDVTMPRCDYEKFLTLSSEFKYPYFLQTPFTDEGYYYSFAKIRNTNTTGLSKAFCFQGFNDGLALDIFPLDNISIDKGDGIYARIKDLVVANSAFMKLSNPHIDDVERSKLIEIASVNPLQTFLEINSLASQFNKESTEYVSHWVTTFDPFTKKIWYAEDFQSTILWDFCGFKVPIPVGYDRYLRNYFGNYMEMPPIDKRSAEWHQNAIFDPDKSYVYYTKNMCK